MAEAEFVAPLRPPSSGRLQRFLAEHQVPYSLPLYDRQGRYLFAAPEKVDVLAQALVRAVGKGHDNELFVLLADLLELEARLDPLLKAVKMTISRHHQVLVVCPWPPGVPPPGAEDPSPEFLAVLRDILALDPDNPEAMWFLGLDALQRGEKQRAAELFRRLLDRLPPDASVRSIIQRQLDAAGS